MQIKTIKHYAIILASVSAVFAALFFFGRAGYQTWNAIAIANINIAFPYLVSSVFLSIAGFFVLGTGYHRIIRGLGIKMPLAKAIKARSLSDISSYIPGKIFTLLTRMHYSSAWMSKAEVLAVSSIETASLILSSVLAFVISFFVRPEIFSQYSVFFYIALPLCLVMMHPRIISFCLNLGLRIFKKELITLNISYSSMITISGIYALYWVLSGISLFFMINAIYPLQWSYMPYLIIAYAVAWTIGFLAFIFPAGIGLREGILMYMLSAYLPAEFALIASIAFRGITLISQLIIAIIFFFF